MSRTSKRTPITRRQALAAGSTAILTSTVGCTRLLNAIGDRLFEDVNVLNQLGREVSGSVEVVDPSGEAVLDKTFDAPSTETDGESNTVTYADVWTDPGEYEITVELADVELEGTSQASETISITDTEAEMVAASIGSGVEDEPIAIVAGESFSDFGQAAPSE